MTMPRVTELQPLQLPLPESRVQPAAAGSCGLHLEELLLQPALLTPWQMDLVAR